MELENEKERINFGGERPTLGAPRKRSLPFRWRIAIWALCLVVFAGVWLGFSGVAFEGENHTLGGTENGGEYATEPPLRDSEQSVLEESERIEESASETERESETAESTSLVEQESEKESAAVVDISFAERGDGYIYNYSKYTPDVEGLLEMGFSGGEKYYSEQPVVLILHTDIREGYCDLDKSVQYHFLTKSVVAVGERVAYELNRRGIPTVHCTVIHGKNGAGAYEEAAETIRSMKEIYPTLKYVIDLRRLEENDDNGMALRSKSALGTAQIRVTVSSAGKSTQQTLALSLALRRELNSGGKRLCAPVVFTDVPLNAAEALFYLKIDVGTQGNTANEAIAAGEYFAEAMASVLKQ